MLCIPNRTMQTVPFVWANMPTRTVIGLKTQRNVGVFKLNLVDVLSA